MLVTVFVVLAITAFVAAVASAAGKCPVWVSPVVLSVIELLRVLPLGK